MNENVRREQLKLEPTEPDYDNLDPHPLAALMPMIEGKDRDALKADIHKKGILNKIMLFAGNPDGSTGPLRILDGRNRYSVAKELGLKLTADNFDVFKGTYAKAEAYVICYFDNTDKDPRYRNEGEKNTAPTREPACTANVVSNQPLPAWPLTGRSSTMRAWFDRPGVEIHLSNIRRI
jgi:hypothetical protein